MCGFDYSNSDYRYTATTTPTTITAIPLLPLQLRLPLYRYYYSNSDYRYTATTTPTTTAAIPLLLLQLRLPLYRYYHYNYDYRPTAATTPTTITATTTTTSRLSVRGPPLDPEGQGDSRKLARTWVQKDKVIPATEARKDKGTQAKIKQDPSQNKQDLG